MGENINDSYFDGYYKEIWRKTVPELVTVRETRFFVDFFGLNSSSHVIDMMCGYGRHSLALASEGIAVTAIDNLKAYIDEIVSSSTISDLPIQAICADILSAPLKEPADLSICMGNSLNFFPEDDIISLLSRLSNNTKPGGHLVINSWSLTEIVAKGFINKHWENYDELVFLSEAKYLFQPTRIETQTTVLKNNQAVEIKSAIDYIFSLSEFERIINQSGFVYQETYSIPGKKRFELGDPRAYIIARKV